MPSARSWIGKSGPKSLPCANFKTASSCSLWRANPALLTSRGIFMLTAPLLQIPSTPTTQRENKSSGAHNPPMVSLMGYLLVSRRVDVIGIAMDSTILSLTPERNSILKGSHEKNIIRNGRSASYEPLSSRRVTFDEA